MSKVLKNMTAVVGKYVNAAGQEKSRYRNIGIQVDTKNGERFKLDFIPVGWDGWFFLTDPISDKPASKAVDFDDDIGF